jgi:hypothetical protein
MGTREHRSRWETPAFGVFAGGLAYALLPTGVFGANDVALRAALTGAVAATATALILWLTARRTQH